MTWSNVELQCTKLLSQTSWHCCDRKVQGARAQSFTLWQQVTTAITRRNHSIFTCSHHLYMGVFLRAHPVRSLVVIWASCWNPLTDSTRFRGRCLSSQSIVWSSRTVRPCSRWIGHWRTTWSVVCSSAPHSQAAEGAILHLCRQERKRPTPVQRRLSPRFSWQGHTATTATRSWRIAHSTPMERL